MTISKLAVGVDFSEDSQRALDHALGLARRTGASLTMIHVAAVPSAITTPSDGAWTVMEQERRTADRVRLEELRVRHEGQGVALSQVIADGDPDTTLADAARELGADLVVVGTHGRTGVRRLLLGSVAEKTIRLASSTVLVARGDAPARGYRDIIVGTDYSEPAWNAVTRAFELAAPGAKVRVVHAWHAPPYLEYDVSGRAIDGLRDGEEVAAQEQRKRLRAMTPAGVEASLEIVFGVPFVVLDGYASADLIVVGSHGRRGVRRFLLGSVAEATARHARCAVLVTR